MLKTPNCTIYSMPNDVSDNFLNRTHLANDADKRSWYGFHYDFFLFLHLILFSSSENDALLHFFRVLVENVSYNWRRSVGTWKI